jgi:hypothetical protein
MIKKILLLLSLFSYIHTNAEEDKRYLIYAFSLTKPPAFDELRNITNKTNNKIKDKNEKERVIFWNEIANFSPLKQKELLEIQRLINSYIKTNFHNLSLIKERLPNSKLQINFLIRTKKLESIEVEIVGDWRSANSSLEKKTKQILIDSIKKNLEGFEFSSSQFILSLDISNLAEISSLRISDFYGICGNIIANSFRKHAVNLDVDFDFKINSRGDPEILQSNFNEGDEFVIEYFKEWFSNCKFNCNRT